MPLLPQDELWSPLFAEARWETQDGEAAATGWPGLPDTRFQRVCWDRAVTVRAPLAVPPPWTGTATLTAPAGCAEVERTLEENGLPLLAIAAPGFVISGEVRLGKTVIHAETVTVEARDPADANRGTFWYAEHQLVRFAPGGAGINGSIFLFGDALPWLREDPSYDRGLYHTFLASTEIPRVDLIRRTGATPYAAAAVFAASVPTGAGDDPAYRARLLDALAGVDLERLTPDERLQIEWARRSLEGWPLTTPAAGRATLVVDPATIAVEVSGKLLLDRGMDAQGAALHAGTARPTTLTVDVPAGEAVYVRTTAISYSAGGAFWHGTGHEGWSVLLPGHTYPIDRQGELPRVAPEGTTCVAVEGAPAGFRVFGTEPSRTREVGGVGAWPRPTLVRPTEPGSYVVELDAVGVKRVRYDVAGCGG